MHGTLNPADWERVGRFAAMADGEALERAAVALRMAGRAEESRACTDALATLQTLKAMARGKGCLTREVVAEALREALGREGDPHHG